jgi:hypothetical protein
MARKQTLKQIAEETKAKEEHAARVHAALHWTETVPPPDVAPPERLSRGLTTGYVFNAHTRHVSVACSSSVGHAIGRTNDTTSHGSIEMYSTRRLALIALRCAMERQFAEALESVDRRIEREPS